ncbi:MAG: hypothetical protein ACI33S_03060 [Bacilli bacterium]
MNKELKRYIKENLKQEKKFSIKKILLFPFTLLISPLSNKNKNILFNKNYCETYEEKKESCSNINLKKSLNNKEKNIPTQNNKIDINTKQVFFDEIFDNDEIENNKFESQNRKRSIEDDANYDIDNDCDIPSFLKSISNIDDFIKENDKYNDFQTTLFKMIDERNLIDSDVYNKVHIDRRLFSKIRNDKKYHPSKETILLLGLSLELNEQEIEKLLDSASYSLPRNNHYDLIIRFCFMKGIYKLTDVNNLLDQYNCKLFNY